jgi:hypothetical protein
MLAAHRSAEPLIGPYSFAALSAIIVAAVSSLVLAILFLLPDRLNDNFHDWLGEGIRSLNSGVPRGHVSVGILLGVLALASYAAIAFRLLQLNREPIHDQYDYLRVAGEIRGMGGAIELGRQLWSGEYKEGNRHPLYTLVLSIQPEFEWGKRLSLAIGFGTLALIWWSTCWRFGWLVGGLSAVLVATNNVFQQSATLVACEMMLVLWSFSVWLVIERIVEKEQCRVANDRSRILSSVVVGALLGLGYLTKASAFFLLVTFLVWSFGVAGLRRWSWLALIAFAIVGSPLLVRNVRAYGDPLYSVNDRFLFADTFDEGLNREFRGTWTEAADYFRTHSAGTIAERALSGLGWEGFVLLRSLGPVTRSHGGVLAGVVLLLTALLGLIGRDWRIVSAAAGWLLPFYVFFAWYGVIARGDRFMAPVIPVVLILSARGTVMLLRAGAPVADRILERRLIFAALLWCIAAITMSWRLPQQRAEFSPIRQSAENNYPVYLGKR